MRRRLIILALGLAAAAAVAAPAGAGKAVPTEVKIKAGDTISKPPLYGRLVSKKDECLEGRRVAIYMVAPNQGLLDYADNRTNAKGKWEFGSQLQGGTSFKASVKQTRSDGVTCRGATSSVVSFQTG